MTRDPAAHDRSDAKLLAELGKLRAADEHPGRQKRIMGELIGGRYPLFVGWLTARTGREAAEEIAGRVELRLVLLLRIRHEFSAPFGAVVWRIVRDERWAFIQEQNTSRETPVAEVHTDPSAEPADDPFEELDFDPERDAERFTKLVGELSVRDQEVIKLLVIDEVPRPEAAERLGMNVNALDQARHRALVRLAKLAKERGVSDDPREGEDKA